MSFHSLYRPRTFDQVIGHETVATRLRGIVADIGKGKKDSPSALLFIGPTSAGKTTLARVFAAEVNGIKTPIEKHPDLIEYNAGANKTMEDVREWVKSASFRPMTKKRIILIDEAQALISNPQATDALLKPLEEPKANTIWILCSMDPSKFTQGKGRAIANRCQQFVLEPHTPKDLYAQALKIAKAESMKYVRDEDKKILKAIVRNCNGEMRTLANLMEGIRDYYAGLKKKPEFLSPDDVTAVLASSETQDDKVAALVLMALYGGKYAQIVKHMLDVADGFTFINKLLWANSYLLNNAALEGARHSKVWPSGTAKQILAGLKEAGIKPTLGMYAATNAMLVEVKGIAQTFATTPQELLTAKMYRLIKEMFAK